MLFWCRVSIFGFVAFLLLGASAQAGIYGTVKTIVHDPHHRPVANAYVVLQSRTTSWSTYASTDEQGVVQFLSVPIGEYKLEIRAVGFDAQAFEVTAQSDRVRELHAQLSVATKHESVEVKGSYGNVDPVSAIPESSVNRTDISRLPGADRTNSMSFITDVVPGSYMVHDQLHVRGGHQVTWAVDGVPVPNTNIATNVGPQFDPKDVEFVEVQRGSYMADYGDRSYGVFNVAPRSGFERKREAELVLGYGSFNQSDDQLSFGDHTDHFAYYVSASGNRTDYGLQSPTVDNLHNQAVGLGLFSSMTYNARNGDQYRFVGSARDDGYDVPNDPAMQINGVHDRENERDAFANITYLHAFNSTTVLTITPFFHVNRAGFLGGPSEVPTTTDNRSSTYAGGQTSLAYTKGKHNAKIGLYAFGQQDSTFFGLAANDGSGNVLAQRQRSSGDLEALFVEDQYRPTRWLTLTGGVRVTRFSGHVDESATSPRVGGALQLPKLHWIARASYSRFYQAPPLDTIAGRLSEFAAEQGVAFLPLRGERDEQHDFGLTIPLRGWNVDLDYFRTAARNFFDHDALGNSNMFFPLTIDRARVRGFEASVRSPKLLKRVDVHLAYSHQSVQGSGAVTGGLTDFTPPEQGWFYLDHDQRDTLSTGMTTTLPLQCWASVNASYGSGFLNGDGPAHLPSYRSVDVAFGKSFGENWSAKITATNISNSRHFVDLSNTFGGSHVSDPRMVSVQLKYRFHY